LLVVLLIRSLVTKKEEAVAAAATAEVKEEKKKPIDVIRRIRGQHHEIRQTRPATPLTKQEHKVAVEVLHRPQNPAHHDESTHGDQLGQSHAASLPHPLHINLRGEYDGPNVATSSLSMTDISQMGTRHMSRAAGSS